MVDFGGDAVGDPLDEGETQSIECSTSWAVKRGDTVLVQLVGAQGTARKPIVVAVRGRGDEQDGRISEAEELAQAAIQAVDVEYALGDSQTTAPTTGWATTAPEWEDGKYMWQRTKTTTASGSSYSDATCIQGAAGADGADGAAGATGRGISAIVEQYYLSTSSTTQTGGSWSTAQPEWAEGKHIWTRSKITWTNPSGTSYTTPVLAKAINGANEAAAATSYYFFVDSEGAHITTTQGDATTGQNILIDSDGLHIRNGTTDLAYFEAGEVGIGMDSTAAKIVLCGSQMNSISSSSSGQLAISGTNGVRLGIYDTQSGWGDYGFGFITLDGKATVYGNAQQMMMYAEGNFFNGAYQTRILGDQVNALANGSPSPLQLQYTGGADVRVGYGAGANLRVNGNIYYAKTHGVTPVYCLYNPNGGKHYYTVSSSEYNSLVNAGWSGQGVAWYGFAI
ncbi:hypothetical protein [Denitrobacterium detoxificans]|nr:hypothetical protein [Denitrobacterium detoxificans]